MAKSIRSFPESQQRAVAQKRLQAGEGSGLSYLAAVDYLAGGHKKAQKKD